MYIQVTDQWLCPAPPAYLSPEVVLKQEMGRPLDIWSVGCVVVEMATGKLPWPEYDNQYQIMFQIGTGKSPSVAGGLLPDEGHDFLSRCFQSRPGDREKASELLLHSFVKVRDRPEMLIGEESWCLPVSAIPSQITTYFFFLSRFLMKHSNHSTIPKTILFFLFSFISAIQLLLRSPLTTAHAYMQRAPPTI